MHSQFTGYMQLNERGWVAHKTGLGIVENHGNAFDSPN